MLSKKIGWSGFLLMAFLVSACETVPLSPPTKSGSKPEIVKPGEKVPPVDLASVADAPPEPVAPVDPVERKRAQLAEALLIYEDGKYEEAISAFALLLPAPDLALSDQVSIQKYLAFAHCALGRVRQCRTHFETILSLDRTFQLSAAEKGHPVWGKEFINARNAVRSKRSAPVKP